MKTQNTKKLVGAAFTIIAILLTAATAHATAGYILDVTTAYGFSNPVPGTVANYADFGGPSPDTGFWNITNNGTTTFSGTIGQTAVSNFGGDVSYSHVLTLAPGASVSFAVNSESSNVGGFNGPFGLTQPGVTIFLTGLINGTESINLSVNDADIHSGVPRTNPFGEIVDSYVLQGGDSLGRDTGDAFETTQAFGHFRFFEAPGAPDGGSTVLLLGSALTGLAALRRKVGA